MVPTVEVSAKRGEHQPPMRLAQWLYERLLETPEPHQAAQFIEGLHYYLQTLRVREQHEHRLEALEQATRQEADTHLDELRREEKQLSLYRERLQNQEARLETALSETARLRTTLKQEDLRRRRQLRHVLTLLHSLRRDLRRLQSSRRWRLGNAIGALFQPLSRRRHSENALHRMERTLAEIRGCFSASNERHDQQ
jgi:chromosome segregation ATPase